MKHYIVTWRAIDGAHARSFFITGDEDDERDNMCRFCLRVQGVVTEAINYPF